MVRFKWELWGAVLILGSCLVGGFPTLAVAETVARCGQGWLEKIDGSLVLHVKGTPYEMGYQHGALLRDHVRANMDFMMEELSGPTLLRLPNWKLNPKCVIRGILAYQSRHVPDAFMEELAGVAAGAEVPADNVRIGNFVPELFHCSGFAVMDSATEDGTLYHGRVLDYAIGWRLQEHAVLIVAEPEAGIPFVNVTYAGFVGSVTGMNQAQVSIGEMGGGGWGHWNGVPMSVLVREVLSGAHDLEEAIAVFRDQPRTCQYFYVIADGKTHRAVGMEASWNRFDTIATGASHPLLPKPVKDCVLLSAGERYEQLAERTQSLYGQISQQSALHLMDRPVAMSSNLHNVLFAPQQLRLWVAHATSDEQPAADQPYQEFDFAALLARQPDSTARSLPPATDLRHRTTDHGPPTTDHRSEPPTDTRPSRAAFSVLRTAQ